MCKNILIASIILFFMTSACSKNKTIIEDNGNDMPPTSSFYNEYITVGTFNIRSSTYGEADGINSWSNRRDWVVSFIKFFDFDVIGLQEEKNDQNSFLRAKLSPEYRLVGVTNSTIPGYEFNNICYHASRIELLESGDFWLSETPDKESLGWNAIYPRHVTWGKFEQKSNGHIFFMFNTHLSHIDEYTREQSLQLIRDKMTKIADGKPAILTGDLNTWPDTRNYNLIIEKSDSQINLNDTRNMVKDPYGPNATGFGLRPEYTEGERLDYIFVSDKNIEVLNFGIITEKRNGMYLSDHYPVISRLLIN